MPAVGVAGHDFRHGWGGAGVPILRPMKGHSATGDSPADDRARWVGLATCVVSALPLLTRMARQPDLLAEPRRLVWLVLLLLFLASYWLLTGRFSGAPTRSRVAGLAALAALALAMNWLVPYALMGVFLVIVAGGLGEVLPPRRAAAWVVGQSALFTLPMLRDHGAGDAAILGGSFLAFQLFALYAAQTAERERRGRQALARVNAELLATRRLLEETSRGAERLRIARDLHDVLGHHLTALSLHLEAARHAAPDESRRAVETAHGIAGGLLAEVRQVVGRMREQPPLDLPAALRELAAGIERPRVHVVVGDGFAGVADPRQAEALLRCAQEMLTNTIRHAHAENLWLELRQGAAGVDLVARDDGRGAAARPGRRAAGRGGDAAFGSGLAGMRERLERLGGRLAVDSRAGEGFLVSAWLPHPDAAGAAEP